MKTKLSAISIRFFASAALFLTILSGLAVPLQTARASTVIITPAASPTASDNDYTRINNAIQAASTGDVIKLLGTFDWTEANAAASWALGSDGIASTADDYEILPPRGVNNVTLTADNLGDATIQGPGDLASVNLEAFLVFDASVAPGGGNQGWTISNLQILDFDLSIAFFATGATDYNDTHLADNYIRIASDLNATVAPADTNQNIGIHFSFGTNQIISGNIIDIQGDAVSDSGSGNFATDVGMQSNTSGGNTYDGLQITDNTIRVLHAQSADPQVILGIWENGHAHTSNITVSGNQFTNQAAGNNPATNLQRAFRVTSHSSTTTTVTYADNTVIGANIGFQWITGSNFTGNQPVELVRNTIMNGATGVLVQSQGLANLSFNRIVGNTVAGVNNVDGTVNAENNWWGCNAGPGNAGCNAVTGTVDFNPWLQLNVSALPSTINSGTTSTITADMTQNSDAATPAGGPLPLIPVTFSATQGTMAPPSGTITAGQASSTFTSTTTSSGTGCATVDNQLTCANVTVVVVNADLAITKTDGVTTATPGGSVTYTITASNAGPSTAIGATVADPFPASLTATWTCTGAGGGTCTASGSGNINDTVNLPVGGSVTYTASATISPSATGTLSNTATVIDPSGISEPNPGNNSATDSDTLSASADLSITKTDGVTTATPGGSVTYTIVASNAGPSNAPGATVADTFPASLTATWTCAGAGGGTCTASGSGNINDTVNLPVGGSVTYTASATISPSATGTLSNTATVTAPAGVTDPTPGNNSATDSDTLGSGAAAPVITEGSSTSVTMSEDGSPTPFALTLHATDANSDPLTWSILSQGSFGTASAAAGPANSSAISYSPMPNYNGSDSFVVQVSDGALTDTITVNVTITPVDDSQDLIWNQSYEIKYDTWFGVTSTNAFGGGYRTATSGTFTFMPGNASTAPFTQFSWITYRGPDQGKAQVIVDGKIKATVDLYHATAQWQYPIVIQGLTNAKHTIVIKPLNSKNAASTGRWVVVDGFSLGGSMPTMRTMFDEQNIHNLNKVFSYGSWLGISARSGPRFGAYRLSTLRNASLQFAFDGTQFAWFTARGPAYGKAQVWVDGVLKQTLDLYRASQQWQYQVPITGLLYGHHTVMIKVLGTKNARSTGTGIVCDGFIIQ